MSMSVARKEHTCGECGRNIWKGEKYERRTESATRSHTAGTHHGTTFHLTSKRCFNCAQGGKMRPAGPEVSYMKCCGLEVHCQLVVDSGIVFAVWECEACGEKWSVNVGEIDSYKATLD